MVERTLSDLEFALILKEVQSLTLSYESKEEIERQRFLFKETEIKRRQAIMESFITLNEKSPLRPHSFAKVESILPLLKVADTLLEPSDLYDLALYIEAAETFITYTTQEESLPCFTLFSPLQSSLSALKREIFSSLEAPGEVKTNHPALMKLYRQIEQKRGERDRFSREFLREHSSEERGAFRDGRVVLPIRADQKSHFEGVVHSYSGTKLTLFVEPYPLVELNNQVVMAQQQIEIEIARIIKELSDLAFKNREDLTALVKEVIWADSLYARALWCVENRAIFPIIESERRLSLLQVRHPLLKKRAIPITLTLEKDIRALVLSGPNAGGKTVTIKTVGLIALIHQAFYSIPAQEGSSLPLFSSIFTDIGDEQSIEKSLSTFSGHLENIGKILNESDENSLLLFDELGSGTDPVEGAALARSVLEYCVEKKSLTLITSHHNVLKQYAYSTPSLLNASMEFDKESHLPTFTIISGLPGQSYALETAKRMGLPETVIQRAESYLTSEMVEISTIIKNLEEKRLEFEQREREIALKERTAIERNRTLDLKALQLQQQEQLIRSNQIGDLSRFISEKRGELENLVAELREKEITKEKTKKVKAFISSLEEKKETTKKKVKKLEKRLIREVDDSVEIEVGMDVRIESNKREGRVVRIERDGTYIVAIGPMKFPVKREELSPIKIKRAQKASISYESSSVKPQSVIDVRGYTLDEALDLLKTQIEASLVHNLSSFSVIHGMGDGILSKGIHQYLSKAAYVKSFYFARPEDGGYGKTYIEF